jgi:hypothetical protein
MHENKFKYPRTPHLPWSPGNTDDDQVLQSTQCLEGKEVLVTEKLDGENTTMYADHIHARSIDSRPHISREWVKKLHANICYLIPSGWRLCGENLYAKHSIAYKNLESYFYLFSIWNDQNECLDWAQTLEWAELLGLKTPKELYRGLWNEKLISQIPIDEAHCEGYVVRTTQSFAYDSFSQHVAKWVRKGHVVTDANWMHKEMIANRLKKNSYEF